MKKIMMLLIFILSSNVFCLERVYTIKDPVYPNTKYRFDKDSDGNLICNVLGFERWVPNTQTIPLMGDFVDLDSDGKIEKVYIGLLASAAVTSITCLNFKGGDLKEVSIEVVEPTHPLSNTPISALSNQDGVCRLLGFDLAMVNSLEKSDGYESYKAVQVDQYGKVVKLIEGSRIESMICLLTSED